MALSGLQIFKLLPGGKKEKEANCKQCGFPTCMAFAMKLAKGEADITLCQFISDELKAVLEDAGQKQQAEITFGSELNRVKTGNETVMFRHDKTFINPTCISVCLNSNDNNFEAKLDEISSYSIERVGETFTISAVALYDNGDFAKKARIIDEKNLPIILISNDFDNILAALEAVKKSKPLVFLKNADSEKLAEIAQKYDIPVVVSAKTVEELAENSEKLLNKEIKDIVLNLEAEASFSTIESLTFLRRAAIEEKIKPLGFPVMMTIPQSGDIIQDAAVSSALLCKYSNILVLENFNKALLSGLFTLRQNIYTDPQKPLQVEAKLYEVGEVTPDSPVFITTNFALTYFAVISEIEASGVPSYLLITSSDGMSVLTAWSASKFTGEIIAKAVKQSALENIVKHRKLIIPGFVASMTEEIEEELPEWQVISGPNDAADIVEFIKANRCFAN
jgi:acetyl-CoA decarbonylase/synthase, CODH/ACS complex subunit gamma